MPNLITAESTLSQKKRLLAYLKKHRKGITAREAVIHLGIACAHKRIAELEQEMEVVNGRFVSANRITRTVETNGKSRYVRYALA